LPVEALDVIFQALILSKATYAFQAFAGHISVADTKRLDKFFRKSRRRGLVNQVFNISSLIDRFDSQLFRSIALPRSLLAKPTTYFLKSAITQCCSDPEDTIKKEKK